jgi:tetratricopeptide (TPR) repeat protein
MSLLNEALRKNKSEHLHKVIVDYSLQQPSNFKKSLFIAVLMICALAVGGLFLILVRQDNLAYHTRIPEPQKAIQETASEAKQEPLFEIPESNEVQQNVHNVHVDDPVRDRANDAEEEMPSALADIQGVSVIAELPDKDENSSEELPSETRADDENTLYRKAIQFHKQGKFKKAIIMYRDVLRYNPQHTEALFNLASVYIELSHFPDAYDILIKLLATTPDDPKTMLNLGITEIGLGKNKDALSHLSIVNNEEEEALQFSLSFHRGVAMSRLGKLDEALVCYKAAEKLRHDHSTLIFNIAVLYDKLGDYGEAISYYSRLFENDSLPSLEIDELRHRVEILQSHISGSIKSASP